MELTYVSYVSFNEVFKNTWMVFTMEPHPPKKHGTPKETMEPPKSTRIMGKSSTTPRYPWENHTPNPSKFHVEFERLNMIQLYKHIMVLTHIYIYSGVKSRKNYPFGNGLYQLLIVKLGMVYDIVLPALMEQHNTLWNPQ